VGPRGGGSGSVGPKESAPGNSTTLVREAWKGRPPAILKLRNGVKVKWLVVEKLESNFVASVIRSEMRHLIGHKTNPSR
jgi:hypothetical protein